MEYLQLPFDKTDIEIVTQSAPHARATFVLAHGAGAGMEHTFMHALAHALHSHGINVVRFNFPYITEKRKFTGDPRRNIAAWKIVAEWALMHYSTPIYLSGKSYGGRMASHLLAENSELDVKGVIYFGFPLHAPGKPSIDRADHLKAIRQPQLFIQGTNDALADIELMRSVQCQLPNTKMVEFAEADHSFKVKGKTTGEIIQELANVASSWSSEISLQE